MEWMLAPLKKYADFSGRARRKEYWMFYLGVGIINTILYIIFPVKYTNAGAVQSTGSLIIHSIFALAVFLPGLAVTVRRLHDVGKSGKYYFMIFIPIVGAILIFIKMLTDSQPGDNQYGPNPKA